jgi:hypothetical protein
MRDRHLGHVGSWRESEWEATFFKRLRLLGMQNGLTVRWDYDRTPIEFLEGIEHYQACMYDAYRAAANSVASDVDYIEATAQAVCDATHGGALALTGSLEERRRRALDRAPSVFTKAAAHAAHLESIQRFGDSISIAARSCSGAAAPSALPPSPSRPFPFRRGCTRSARRGSVPHSGCSRAIPTTR